jgi:hypothetical protein
MVIVGEWRVVWTRFGLGGGTFLQSRSPRAPPWRPLPEPFTQSVAGRGNPAGAFVFWRGSERAASQIIHRAGSSRPAISETAQALAARWT